MTFYGRPMLDAILKAARAARDSVKFVDPEAEVNAWVLTWRQRDALRLEADYDSGYRSARASAGNRDPDMLFDRPILYATDNWSCPSNLIDLRKVKP